MEIIVSQTLVAIERWIIAIFIEKQNNKEIPECYFGEEKNHEDISTVYVIFTMYSY